MSANKIAVVTGGSRGIGKAVAHELIECGYQVILVARSLKNLEAAKNEFVKIHAIPEERQPQLVDVDLSDEKAVIEAANHIVSKFGKIDLLFNGAGISIPGTLDQDSETFSKLFAVNLRAPFLFMKAIIPAMVKQGGGRIINMASRNGKVAVSGLGGYSASKFGLIGLDESLYREFSAQNISITTICPGWVNTEMASGEGGSMPPGLMIQPEDIAKTVRWLLSMSPSVRVMDVLLECASDVERRASVELAKLYALRDRHREEFDALVVDGSDKK